MSEPQEIPLGVIADFLEENGEPGQAAFLRAIEWMRTPKEGRMTFGRIEDAAVYVGGTLHNLGNLAFREAVFGVSDDFAEARRESDRKLMEWTRRHSP